jgi:hypothetical protein
MTEQKSNKDRKNPQAAPVGNYNPGGQAGESVRGGGQRPADEPGGPFLGKQSDASSGNPNPGPGSANAGTPGGKGKQDAKQNHEG